MYFHLFSLGIMFCIRLVLVLCLFDISLSGWY
jgi:hypothetical protein